MDLNNNNTQAGTAVASADERQRAIFADNRAEIFDALRQHHIRSVTIVFDGYGDSGQVEEVAVVPETAPDPSVITLIQKHGHRCDDRIETIAVDLRTALEDLIYELLEQAHAGWEINEGSFGRFIFDADAGRIALEYNQRYEDSVLSRHEF